MAELRGGSIMDFSGSMADAMLQAMDEALAESGRPAMSETSRPGMQTLFVAIARGVIRHMKANEAAFHVQFPGTSEQIAIAIDVQTP
jgi:hypothetical protein